MSWCGVERNAAGEKDGPHQRQMNGNARAGHPSRFGGLAITTTHSVYFVLQSGLLMRQFFNQGRGLVPAGVHQHIFGDGDVFDVRIVESSPDRCA